MSIYDNDGWQDDDNEPPTSHNERKIVQMSDIELQQIIDNPELVTERTYEIAEAENDRRDRDASDPAAIADRQQAEIDSEGFQFWADK